MVDHVARALAKKALSLVGNGGSSSSSKELEEKVKELENKIKELEGTNSIFLVASDDGDINGTV